MSNEKSRPPNKRCTASKTAKTDLNQTYMDSSKAQTRWSNLRSHLEFASMEWAELDKKNPVKSPEEEQFEKVKSIIENLKDKLNEF